MRRRKWTIRRGLGNQRKELCCCCRTILLNQGARCARLPMHKIGSTWNGGAPHKNTCVWHLLRRTFAMYSWGARARSGTRSSFSFRCRILQSTLACQRLGARGWRHDHRIALVSYLSDGKDWLPVVERELCWSSGSTGNSLVSNWGQLQIDHRPLP